MNDDTDINTRLMELIDYSYNEVGYYREAFEHTGIKPDMIASVADLHKLPVLAKETTQNGKG
jgi:phenylacetate-coenzyme A ligase PaaK-like adenylate-forming protein